MSRHRVRHKIRVPRKQWTYYIDPVSWGVAWACGIAILAIALIGFARR